MWHLWTVCYAQHGKLVDLCSLWAVTTAHGLPSRKGAGILCHQCCVPSEHPCCVLQQTAWMAFGAAWQPGLNARLQTANLLLLAHSVASPWISVSYPLQNKVNASIFHRKVVTCICASKKIYYYYFLNFSSLKLCSYLGGTTCGKLEYNSYQGEKKKSDFQNTLLEKAG